MKVFLTFANTSYMRTDRIASQARNMGVFDQVLQYNEHSIPDFIQKHKRFIKMHPQGYGFWIWKPKIIRDVLDTMQENDILVYCDAGCYLNKQGIPRFYEYIEYLKEYSIVTFSTSDSYKAQQYVKSDVIMSYYPPFANEWTTYRYAGVMLIKKTQSSLALINDWLALCENYHFLDRSLSTRYPEFFYYIGNDCDNGLFNLCLSKYHTINKTIEPDEINLYKDGVQHQDASDEEWRALDSIPFQVRRISPRYQESFNGV